MKLKIINPFFIYKNRELIPRYIKYKSREIRNVPSKACRNLQVFFANKDLPLTENDRKIFALKNKYIGKRCFVIGNGPSLRMDDLQRIHENGDISIASNKIFLAFCETDWRPDYYTVIDSVVMENNTETINTLNLKKIFPLPFKNYVTNGSSAIYCNFGNEGHWNGREFVDGFKPGFSNNILNKIYPGESVTYWNIQIAYYLGCSEIILLGVDFSFKIPKNKIIDKTFEYILINNNEVNHFSKNYREENETWTMPHLKEQAIAFKFAKEYCEKQNVKIFNASRQSKLKVFDKINFDSII